MMGFKLKRTEALKLAPNEEKELCLVLEAENRAAIHGVVKFPGGVRPVHGALVKLFRKDKDDRHECGKCDLIPVTFAYTDDCGQFLFGVDTCFEYVIKVFFYRPETIGPPQCDERECHEGHDCRDGRGRDCY